ncbi:hypothetical protein [Marinicrinis sediminis]|uniref:Uncharacterized protein n=1 Tax=Marinicrinis sediminis TaxID=1652465 RepID=A0ABW5RBS6_9BACL
MAEIVIRPDMRTHGGEVSDILLDNHYVGSICLVYRERERMTGSIQLDKESLTPYHKRRVNEHVHAYVESLMDAMNLEECDVMVTYSRYDHVIASDTNVGVIDEFVDEEMETDLDRLSEAEDGEEDSATYFELVVVNEYHQTTEYEIYDYDQQLVADAVLTQYDHEIYGEVNWQFLPHEEEMEQITNLLISDYEEDEEVVSFVIDMKHSGKIIETEELTHVDVLDAQETEDADEYSVVLSRDDEDTLTYSIYHQSEGGIPIGTATIDVSSRQLSGYVDLRDTSDEKERELMATMLMRELDKERDYRSFNLTLFYRNEPIDELHFQQEEVFSN